MTISAIEAGTRFRSGTLTPEALTQDILTRIAAENPRLNAYYEVFENEARQEAANATRAFGQGVDGGPMHGIPVAIKDLFDVAGHVTSAGAHPGFRPPPARSDSDVVARLRAAGAVLLGKSATHEWALGFSTNNEHFGPTRNPNDPERIPGGSSGGSAAALAAGLAVLALGSDTGGSIRVPAALCGVVGLKPTYGLVSLKGVTPLSRSLDHAGPMGTTVEDVFTMLEAISDWRRSPAPRPRVLRPDDSFLGEVDRGIADLIREASGALGNPETVDLGDMKPVRGATTTILYSDAAAFHEERLRTHPDWFGSSVRERLPLGLTYRGVDYARARDLQREWTAKLTEILGKDGVLILPTTAVTATKIGDPEGADLSRLMSRLTAPFNFAGAPALSVPVGRVGGLPVGMQLVAAPGKESLLLEAGRRVEAYRAGAVTTAPS